MSAGQKTRDSRPGAATAARGAVLRDDSRQKSQSPLAETGTSGGGFAALFPAALMLVAGLGGLTLASLLADGVEGQFVVVSPPWQPAVHLVTRADGALLAGGGFSNVIVAASDRPGFADDLRAAGAWLVFPAPRALGCGAAEPSGKQADMGAQDAAPVFQKSLQTTDQQAGSL